MKTYVSLLKIIGILLLIPVGLGLIVLFGFVGFGIDFSNAWDNKNTGGSSSMYMLILPLGFISITGWAIYTLAKRNSVRKTERQKTEIREQVYRERGLGTNNHEAVVNILSGQESKTVIELSELLRIDQEQTLKVTRELLQSGRIHQDVKQNPARFYV